MYSFNYLGTHQEKILGIRGAGGVLQVATTHRGQKRKVGRTKFGCEDGSAQNYW